MPNTARLRPENIADWERQRSIPAHMSTLFSTAASSLTEQKRHRVDRRVLVFLTLGITLDVTATICMIIGSDNPPWTLHGLLGYSSLTGMLIDASDVALSICGCPADMFMPMPIKPAIAGFSCCAR